LTAKNQKIFTGTQFYYTRVHDVEETISNWQVHESCDQ